ncbi:hypothetical protein HYZ97_03640 [Candidatus Pacearchaeota archaeon]|nr:hypothetical protein [Candidatus Pacearchaeota archaeon]
MIIKAKLKSVELDGIEILDKSLLGKEYLVELDSNTLVGWFNIEHLHGRKVECVQDVIGEGYLPLELLDFSFQQE